jgi:hypothetical protein
MSVLSIGVCILETLSFVLRRTPIFRKSWRENQHEWRRRGMHIGYWWESQKVRDHWEGLDVGGWTILKWILER